MELVDVGISGPAGQLLLSSRYGLCGMFQLFYNSRQDVLPARLYQITLLVKGFIMKAKDVFPSKYLKSEDIDAPLELTVQRVVLETMVSRTGEDEQKPVMYFEGGKRGLVLNQTNWNTMVRVTGEHDSDDWYGHKVVLYVDHNIQAFGDIVSGLRLRKLEPVQEPDDDFPPF